MTPDHKTQARLPRTFFGRRESQGYEQNLLNLVDLINSAEREIKIASEKIDPEYYSKSELLNSLKDSLDRGCTVQIVAGLKSLPNTAESLSSLGCEVIRYDQPMVLDLVLVDEKHYMTQPLNGKGVQTTFFYANHAIDYNYIFALYKAGATTDKVVDAISNI